MEGEVDYEQCYTSHVSFHKIYDLDNDGVVSKCDHIKSCLSLGMDQSACIDVTKNFVPINIIEEAETFCGEHYEKTQ